MKNVLEVHGAQERTTMKKFLFTLATLMLLTSSPTLGELCGSLVAPLYRPGHSSVTQTAAEPAKLSGLRPAAQAQISAVLGRDQSSYHAVRRASGLRMENRNHGLAAHFTSKGVEVRAGRASWSLALRGYGYGNDLQAAVAVVPQADANRLEYRRDGFTEWYLNGPLGLEQGFTLTQSPGERRSDPLMVDPFIQQAKLTSSDGAVVDQFGFSVAVSGDTIVVGAVSDDIGANLNQGSAYVFVKPAGGWSGALTENSKLIAADGALDDQFGFSVAVNGDTIVVGAHFDDIGANVSQGSAYVFVKPAGGWSGNLTQNAKLTASDGMTSDAFANTGVALSGDTIVAGTQSDDIGANVDQGSAYVFVKPAGGWSGALSESAKLAASDGAVVDFFGISPAVSGDTIVVGARGDDIGANSDQGSAYVFVKPAGGWSGALSESAKLAASDGAPSDFFGSSVAVSGDTIVAGALADDTAASFNHGSAYVFLKPVGGWSGTLAEHNKLIASDGAAGDFFGSSVAVSAGTIVVGAQADDIGGNVGQGSAYVFVRPEADLGVTKAGSPDPVLAGNDLTYTITVTNNGPDDASSVTVTDNLPSEVTFVSCNSTGAGSCSGSGNNRTVTFASLPAGASETVTLVANVDAAHGTIITNTASVASTTFDPNPENDSVTTTTSVINQAFFAYSNADPPDTHAFPTRRP